MPIIISWHPRLFWRKEGDSNPRYGYPYDSLANCWFQPLTHPSFVGMRLSHRLPHYGWCEIGCKGTAFFLTDQIFWQKNVFYRFFRAFCNPNLTTD